MKRYVSGFVLGIVCFVLGAAVQRYYDSRRLTTSPAVRTAESRPESGTRAADVGAINFQDQPLWAYGFDRPPAPGEKAALPR